MGQKISDQNSRAKIKKIEKNIFPIYQLFGISNQSSSNLLKPDRIGCAVQTVPILVTYFSADSWCGYMVYRESREFNYELISQVCSELNRDSPKQRRRNGAEIRGLGQYDVIKSKNSHNGVQNIIEVAGDHYFLCVQKIIQTKMNTYYENCIQFLVKTKVDRKKLLQLCDFIKTLNPL